MRPYDVCIAYVSWDGGGKRRPVLLISENSCYTEAFRITSQYANKSEAVKSRYFEIRDWRRAGLLKPSYIDTIEPIEVPTACLSTPIGVLSDDDKLRLIDFLK